METQEILQGIHDWTNGKIVYDISVAHPDGQGNPTPYANLTAALGSGGGNIPEGLRKGGMNVKFIQGTAQSSDNKYVQYMCKSSTWSSTPTDWEKINNVSVSQNTETGHADITVGGTTTSVASAEEIETKEHLLTLDTTGNNIFDETYIRKDKLIKSSSPYNIMDFSGGVVTGFYKIPSTCEKIIISGIKANTAVYCTLNQQPIDNTNNIPYRIDSGRIEINITEENRAYPYLCVSVYRGSEPIDLSDVFISFGDRTRDCQIEITNIIGTKTPLSYPSKNSLCVNGYIAWATGDVSSNGYHSTSFIPVKTGDRIKLSNFVGSISTARLAAYGLNKSYLQDKSVKGGSFTDLLYIVPKGVSYVRCCCTDAAMNNATIDIERLSTIKEITTGTKYNNDILTKEGYLILKDNGSLFTHNEFVCSEDYIPVTPKTKYKCQFNATGTAGVCFYDTEKNYINEYWQSTGDEPAIFIVPDDAAFARFCNRTTKCSNPYFDLIDDDYLNLRQLTEEINEINAENYSKSIIRLYPQTKLPCVSFQFDDIPQKDSDIVSLFETYRLTCAFAFIASENNIQNRAKVYNDYQKRGFQIMNHSVDGTIFNLTNYTYQTALETIATALNRIQDAGMVCNGFVSPSSSMEVSFMPILKMFHSYAFTSATTDATANGRSQNTCDLHRYSLESHTLAEIKQYIDDCITNDQIMTFYGHAANLVDEGDASVFSLAKIAAVIEYCITKRNAGLLYIGGTDDCVKYFFDCQIDEVFDITVYNNNTKYADLSAALNGGANIPQPLQKGGMSVKFVQTSDNKYVQYRCMADDFTTDVEKWQGSTNEIKAGSKDLAESGGVYNKIINTDLKIGDVETLTPAQNNVDITEDRVSYQVGIISDSGVIDSTYTKNTIFYFNVENILRLHGKSRIYLDSGKSTSQISFYSSKTPSQSSLISLVNKYEGSIVRIEDFDVFVPEGAKIAGISSTDTSSNSFQVIADKMAVYNDLQSQISKGSLYDNLKDDPTIVDIRSDLSWDRLSAGSSRVTDNGDGTYTFTRLSASGGGAYSKTFVSNSDNVRIKIDAVASNGNFGLALFGILEDQSQISLGNLYQGGSETHTTVSFDAAYLNVYRSTVAFKLQVFSAGTQAAGDTVTYKISVYEGSEIEKTSIYNKDFEPMMVNIDNSLGLKANKSDVPIETILISPNGNKFVLNVDNNGNLTTSPITPNKVVFVGNSLLAGMGGNDHGGFYGMCASSPYKDYAYYVKQEILEKNPSTVFTKVHGGGFEQSENMNSVNSWWNGNNIITGQPTKNAFTSDIDLVIIQLGDNINNSARVELLNTSFDVLINNIRQNSPSARIIWVDGWFNAEKNHTIISSKCNKWKIPDVFIKSLNTTENQGVSGMISTRYDGTTFVVPDTYISHPGDNGFELIADMIISALNM